MDVKQTAIQVLRQAGAALRAQVITGIKRQRKRGERPGFLQHGRGYIDLSQWMEHGVGAHRSTPDLFEIDEEALVTGEVKWWRADYEF